MAKVIVERPVLSEEEREQLRYDRATFCCLLMILCNGGQSSIDDFLKDKDAEDRAEYARIWDHCSTDPVGAIFQRPNFGENERVL